MSNANKFDGQAATAFRRMWADGVEAGEIAASLGVSLSFVHKQRIRLGLPPRYARHNRREVDPTPEEIAERARECREWHYALRRGETA